MAAEEEEGSSKMRHIVIDLFASSLGLSCSDLTFTTFPNSEDRSLPTFHFCPQDYMLSRPFQKGVLITWRQGPGIFVRAYSLIPPLLQPIPNLCEDADVSRRSFHCHHIVPVYLEQRALKTPQLTATFSSSKPLTEFTIFEFHQHLGAVPKALCRKKRGFFCIRELVYEKGPWWVWVSLQGRIAAEFGGCDFLRHLENRGQGKDPVITAAAMKGRLWLEFWHHSPQRGRFQDDFCSWASLPPPSATTLVA